VTEKSLEWLRDVKKVLAQMTALVAMKAFVMQWDDQRVVLKVKKRD